MSKTLTVTEEAYERLASKKGPGESFSRVIITLTGKSSMLDLVGVVTENEASEIRDSVLKSRKRMRTRLEKTRRRL